MRTKKKSSGKIPEKKSAVPYEIADAIQTNRGASGFATYKIS